MSHLQQPSGILWKGVKIEHLMKPQLVEALEITILQNESLKEKLEYRKRTPTKSTPDT